MVLFFPNHPSFQLVIDYTIFEIQHTSKNGHKKSIQKYELLNTCINMFKWPILWFQIAKFSRQSCHQIKWRFSSLPWKSMITTSLYIYRSQIQWYRKQKRSIFMRLLNINKAITIIDVSKGYHYYLCNRGRIKILQCLNNYFFFRLSDCSVLIFFC